MPESLTETAFASFLHRPLPKGLEGLAELALDLRWHGSQLSDRLWEKLDPDAWEQTENPFMILQNVSQARLEEVGQDTAFQELLRHALDDRRRSLEAPGWFGQRYSGSDLKSVTYFSMEFGLSEALPIYSGGLGILAGDFLKTAADMGVPLVGIGLLYQQGYFRQILDANGWQLEAFPYNDPTVLPVIPVEKPEGGWLRVSVWLPGHQVQLRVWQACVGRITLYLLDSNDSLNSPWDRGISATLYPAGQEPRLVQEIVLGIGGWKVLEALGIEPDVCHLNEGHAAFVALARAYSFMQKTGRSFPEALWATRAGNVFTTHTAVAAGFDRYDSDLIRKYARSFTQTVGNSVDGLLDLGRSLPERPEEPLNMAFLAIHTSGQVTAVSRPHRLVSRRLFEGLFPRWPVSEVPVGYVTNGVHIPSWDSEAAGALWTQACGKENWQEAMLASNEGLQKISDTDLWNYRNAARRSLVEHVRRRLVHQAHQHAAPEEAIQRAGSALNPDALTLGFARRFASYKRPTLLLQDPARLAALLSRSERPLQLIVAGKAHPNDEEGKRLVQEMANFASQPYLSGHIVFIEDYDISLMQQLAAGIDVWINTPRRPWEACGTSGMKLLVNGGLNLSELDGWWAEAYRPEVGWALGDGQEHTEPDWDAKEAGALYDLLEQQILPEFYDRNPARISEGWIRHIRASMSELTPQYSSYRMLREYVEQVYLPSASAFHRRTADGAALAATLQKWQQHLAENWNTLRFGALTFHQERNAWNFTVEVAFGSINPDSVYVELYADPLDDLVAPPVKMKRAGKIAGAGSSYLYTAKVPATRPAEHYTPRIVPFHPEAHLPLEENHILWQR